jgi:hypothetical protein
MRFRIKNDWKTFYPCHCEHCKWTGCSQDVIPLESYEYDGPFYCPVCLKQDPTDWDNYMSGIKDFVEYAIYRATSILLTPIHLLVHWKVERDLQNWIKRSEE